MEQLNMVICDSDEQYVTRLAEYFVSKKGFPYALWYFSQTSDLLEFLGDHVAEVLLVSDKLMTEASLEDAAKNDQRLHDDQRDISRTPNNVNHIFYLTADRQQSLSKQHFLYQYQSAENLLRAIYEQAEIPGELLRTQEITANGALIGFFTPIGRCLQSTLCLTIGQILARSKRVLYLDLEGCSALESTGNTYVIQDTQFDLSDLIYFYVHSRDKFISKLTTMKRSINGLDYIAPVRTYQDLQAVTADEWSLMLQCLLESGLYEYILLDLGKELQGIFQILNLCGSIITITRKDVMSSRKLQCYDKMLSLQHLESIKERNFRQELPEFRELPNRPEEYTYGELGRCAAKIIEEVLHEQL